MYNNPISIFEIILFILAPFYFIFNDSIKKVKNRGIYKFFLQFLQIKQTLINFKSKSHKTVNNMLFFTFSYYFEDMHR